MSNNDWIQEALDAKGSKGKPRGEGTLTAQAKSHGKSVKAFAVEVENNPEDYETITKQRVNFYRVLTKQKKKKKKK